MCRSHNLGVVRYPLLIRPESVKTELINSAGEEKEFVMSKDSGGSSSSRDGQKRDDNLSLGEANGDKSVESRDSRHEGEEDDGEGEEGREPKVIRAPKSISREERDAHEATHMPFRSWCRHCVRARARNMQHAKGKDDEEIKSKVPRISMDYFFMSEEDRRASSNPLFVMIDEESKERYARAVGKKGVTDMDWLIKDVVAELRSWGHQGGERGELILKSDNENSIVAVRDAVGKFLGGRIIPESPAKGESKSNGEVEEAGKTVREFAVVLKDMMEFKAKINIEQDDVIVPWMVRWAAMLISRFKVGKDGKTGYERRRGRKCKIPVVPFGETVWYKLVRETKDRKDKFNSEWEEGVWLGQVRSSNEIVIGTKDGVVRAYAVRRQDEASRWQGDRIKDIKGTPSQPDPNKPGLHIPLRVRFDPIVVGVEAEEVVDREAASRRERITHKTLEKYGYTEGCDGCTHKRAGLGETKNHSEACRARIDERRRDDRGQGQGDQEGERAGQDQDQRAGQDQDQQEHREHEQQAEGQGGPGEHEHDQQEPGVVWWKPKSPEQMKEDQHEGEPDQAHPGKWWRGEQGEQEMEIEEEDLICPESDHEHHYEPQVESRGVKRQVEKVEHKIMYEKKRKEEEKEAEKRKRAHEEQSDVKKFKMQQKEADKRKREAQEIIENAEKKARGEERVDGSNGDQGKVEGEIAAALYRASQPDIAEFYSPPRVNEEAKKWGLTPGMAFDLTVGWDFRRAEDRKLAMAYVKEKKPRLVIGSPMCTMFSALQNLSKWNEEKQIKWCEAREHIRFMIEIYKVQLHEGRWFLHEHPASASSWDLEEMNDMEQKEKVKIYVADQCMYGLKTWGFGKSLVSAKKKTKFMTNCESIGRELSVKCDGSHDHQPLVGGRAAGAARYPPGLCKAICRGLCGAIKENVLQIRRLCTVTAPDEIKENRENKDIKVDPNEWHDKEDEWMSAWDDITGEMLDSNKVMKARLEEISYVEDMKVWVRMTRKEAQSRGLRIIGTRWIDVNKGDANSPVYRSRLVGKEFNDGHGDGLFASTPPLEALRYLVSDVATIGAKEELGEKVIMINDVSRAFFEAPMRREMCAEIPREARTRKDDLDDLVALLKMSLYGTRDAAANFQEEVKKLMLKIGFTRGRYNTSTYFHKQKKLKVLVHGDDFVSSGMRQQALWFKNELEKRFKIKTKVIGNGEGEMREATVLNRTIRVMENGWEYEADQRHADIIVKELNLRDAKGVKTPGEDEKPWLAEEDATALAGKDATGYRALSARSNYLAQDRSDIQYAVKEICRAMSAPTKGDLRKLRRLGRYLIERPRVVIRYDYQGNTEDLNGYSDSDWAGCRRTAKSTSGGAVLKGSHWLKSWSTTQKNVTLSSGEAELVAAIKMSAELIGITQLAHDWGDELQGHVHVDSSAAIGIIGRRGCGKMRHVKVGMLWIQEKQEEGELKYQKVLGTENPGDLMTKYLGQKVIDKLSTALSQKFTDGRASSGLTIE